jgi:hypothetical protein
MNADALARLIAVGQQQHEPDAPVAHRGRGRGRPRGRGPGRGGRPIQGEWPVGSGGEPDVAGEGAIVAAPVSDESRDAPPPAPLLVSEFSLPLATSSTMSLELHSHWCTNSGQPPC